MLINSSIELCNLALLKVGQNTISSLSASEDKSVQSLLCRYNYDQSRQSLLSQYQWSFACKEAELQKVSDGSSFKYDYKYTLPGGFLRLVTLYDSSKNEIIAVTHYKPLYDIQENYIFTDIDGCKIKYVFDLENVERMSPLFKNALVLDIAIRITKTLNDSTTYLQALQAEYQVTFAQAKIEDARQKQINQVKSYPLFTETRSF